MRFSKDFEPILIPEVPERQRSFSHPFQGPTRPDYLNPVCLSLLGLKGFTMRP